MSKKAVLLTLAVALVALGAMAQDAKGPGSGTRDEPPLPFVPYQGPGFCEQPFVSIPDSGATSDTLSVADSFILTDVDVLLNVTHTWVGDLIFSITSPMSTTVTVFDRPGEPASTFGCSGNDIDAILDDSAGTNVENVCGAGTPTINGVFAPNNPLSAFNGEDAQGVWTINASDNAGGDTGTLNEWCIITDPVPVELMEFSID